MSNLQARSQPKRSQNKSEGLQENVNKLNGDKRINI